MGPILQEKTLMKRQTRILAGTAIGLLMASTALGAATLPAQRVIADDPATMRHERADLATAPQARVILAQAQEEEEEEERRERAEPEAEQPQEEAQPEPQPEPQAQEAQPEPEPEAPAQAAEPQEEPAAEEQAQPQQEEPAEEQPAQAEQPAEQHAEEEQAQPQQEEPAEQQPAQAEEPAQEEAPAQAEQPAEDPAEEEQAQPEQEEPAEQQAEEPASDAPARAERRQRDRPADRQAQPEGQAPTDQQAQPEGEAPAEQQAQPEGEAPVGEEQARPEGEAPILDSAKEEPAGIPSPEGQAGTGQPAQEGQQAQPAEDAGPPPQTDAEAQATIEPTEIQPVTAEEGQRIEVGATREARREFRREREERRENTEVVRRFEDNRTIIQINNRVYIDSPDYERIIRDRDEVYYEELPRGRQREVVVRADGSRIITVRNRYGDIVRRSRIMPDNREIVLVYVDERNWGDGREWRDPGQDLPPLRLRIPREEYILEARMVDNPDNYYAFFDQPPVERVTRTYSIEEVKRSARVRDIARRVDLDTIIFEFGSASIAESEIAKLEGVAQAMERLLEENPGETFLIEGHTDAVGSDLANLALSDRRAESVARALTDVFGIPPENLATQGYGEQYLKVNTEEPERENRRVAMRRITALVAPVASAQ
jgi:outer membrane protein OmpA-like peptidoglycan-associated protein